MRTRKDIDAIAPVTTGAIPGPQARISINNGVFAIERVVKGRLLTDELDIDALIESFGDKQTAQVKKLRPRVRLENQ